MDCVPEEERGAACQQSEKENQHDWILLIEQIVAKSLASTCDLASGQRIVDPLECIGKADAQDALKPSDWRLPERR